MKKIYYISAITCGLLLLGSGCKKPARPPRPAPTVTVVKTVKDTVVETVYIVGKVKADDEANLVARVSGFLVKTNFDEGEEVKKGDLLFLIEQEQYKAALTKAKANLLTALATSRNANIDYERKKKLYAKRAVAKYQFDDATAIKMKAEAAVMQAKAEVKLAELNLSYTEVRAPFDGYVGLENYSEGSYVGPNSGALSSVVKMSEVRVEYEISDKMVIRARRLGFNSMEDAERIGVFLFTPDGRKYKHSGKITYWDNKINRNTGTLKMQAMFPNPELVLVPGMYVRVALRPQSSKKAVVVPQVAVARDLSGYYVMLVNNENKVERRKVIPGVKQGTNIEIKQGLGSGEKVVISGLQMIRPGISVKTVEGKPYTDGKKELRLAHNQTHKNKKEQVN
eukprot:gnl/Carplike_NY0171/3832_a5170_319.p1 GENE.gnl/Carplike_NY0171/3832_a5170_319~~gnl/Carplike_NY0171/3832_a5170_319.p1  ORF type:complete len:395 (-),score=37.68 gnl/Carplike_NY0171/3832_a5170_319:145-1329(-)